MLMHILNVAVGMTFSGGLIDLVLFGILQGNAKTNWVWIIVVGVFYALVYYFVFYYMIKRFDLKTPGREIDGEETKLYTRKDMEKQNGKKTQNNTKNRNDKENIESDKGEDLVSQMIIEGLGGRNNISDIDCCATRLRVTVVNSDLVLDSVLKQSGASGVIRKGDGVQIIYGPQVSVVKSNLEDYIEKIEENIEEHLEKQPEKHPEKEAKCIYLYSHMKGKALPLEKVDDEAFSSKALGEGAAIEPLDGKLYSPCDGRVETVFDTKHAITIISKDGCELLLHIGIDTVKLGGSFFEAHVTDGQQVNKGDLLITFDMDKIKTAGYQLTTPIIVCNTDDYISIELVHTGNVDIGEKIIEVK